MDSATFRRVLRRAFWLPFAIATVLAVILILEVRFLVNGAAWVAHSDEVLTVSQRIYRHSIDQESALRAYLLTNDKRYLDTFYAQERQVLAMEPQLRQLASDSPELMEQNDKSARAFAAWSAWAEKAIGMAGYGEDAAEREFQLEGNGLMDRYREAWTEFIEREQTLRALRITRSRRAAEILNSSVVVFCVLFAAGVAFLGRRLLTKLAESYERAQAAGDADLQGMTVLRDVGTLCLLERDNADECLNAILKAGIAISGAPKGNIQLFDPGSGALRIVAQHGFGAPFLSFFATASGKHTACGSAMRATERVIVEDVTHSEIFAGQPELGVLLEAGVRAVQSTPLISSEGSVLGMISTHFPEPHRPGERELRLLDLLARQAADYVERRRAEEALRKADRLAGAGRMAATVAHEINNPLSSVVNCLYLLGKEVMTSPGRKYFDLAMTELERVVHITKQTLNFYRTGDKPVRFDLCEIAKEVAGFYEFVAEMQGIRLECRTTGSCFIVAFAGEARQVLTNLVANAIESGSSKVRINVRASRPLSDSSQYGIRLTVIDNGRGISKEHLTGICEPFFTTKGEKGTGLGLWVTKGIVSKHEGNLRIRSSVKPGASGTCVSILLPGVIESEAVASKGIA